MALARPFYVVYGGRGLVSTLRSPRVLPADFGVEIKVIGYKLHLLLVTGRAAEANPKQTTLLLDVLRVVTSGLQTLSKPHHFLT